MSDALSDIQASFFEECEELLEALTDGLNLFLDEAANDETIHEIFRAVHSIKGGAGAFGFESLVEFAHSFENCLDELRSTNRTAEADDWLLFLRASDVLNELILAAQTGDDTPPPAAEGCMAELRKFVSADGTSTDNEKEIDFQPAMLSLDLPTDAEQAPPEPVTSLPPLTPELPDGGQQGFIIHFAPDTELFHSGNEPLHILRALSELGTLHSRCIVDLLPGIDELQPEHCYLSWEIHLETEATHNDVAKQFEFVEDLCELSISSAGEAAGEFPRPTSPPATPNMPDMPPLPEVPPPPLPPQPEATPPAAPVETTPKQVGSTADTSPPASAKPAAKKTAPKGSTTVRVDLERVDRLINQVGELVINQSMLSQSIERAGISNNLEMTAALDDFLQLTSDIQDSVMAIRAQPVKPLFQRMARIVREVATETAKSVRLRTVGEETELDKTVIERLADPLTHMIRNAVDHGLEDPGERMTSGKPKDGEILLQASHQAGRVLIEVSDDGKGIDRKRVVNKAMEKGLIVSAEGMSDQEIDHLLFMPGFSTAEEVSNLSGRGVGMDVVQSAITSLGGDVSIRSKQGKGTSFLISLPLTLAVQDSMVVKIAGQVFVIPISSIVETMTLADGQITTSSPGNEVLLLRGKYVPVYHLEQELGLSASAAEVDNKIALLVHPDNDDEVAALIVDSIVEQRQVVIKGLDDVQARKSGVSAATILGDGQIALILDAKGVIRSSSRDGTRFPDKTFAEN